MKTLQFDFLARISELLESFHQTQNVHKVIYILFISIKSYYSMIFLSLIICYYIGENCDQNFR